MIADQVSTKIAGGGQDSRVMWSSVGLVLDHASNESPAIIRIL